MFSYPAYVNMGATAPTVNLNGATAESLLEQYSDAADKVYSAIRATAGLVHGRDYPDAPTFARALREHRERMDALHFIYDNLQSVMTAIYGQR